MGALSPRTRNAQVAMYQNGEVDHLVATDAIGMGLNLDIDHVAFSGLSKFDGRRMRPLAPNELAQIAGRAGRYLQPGTFGVTGEARALPDEVAKAIEDSRFAPIRRLQWRNRRLDFGTAAALIATLEAKPDDDWLVRGREADDLAALKALAAEPAIAARLADARDVRPRRGRSPRTGSPGRFAPWTNPRATSTPCPSGWPLSAPGPSSPSAAAGFIRKIIGGRKPAR